MGILRETGSKDEEMMFLIEDVSVFDFDALDSIRECWLFELVVFDEIGEQQCL